MSILIFRVTKETVVVDLYLSILVAVLQAQLDVLTQRLAFLLDEARHDGKQYLALGIHRIDIFFFKDS